jgi:hypothetical protein
VPSPLRLSRPNQARALRAVEELEGDFQVAFQITYQRWCFLRIMVQ